MNIPFRDYHMKFDTAFLLIGALAKQANTTKDTIRHYDELGLMKSRKRQAGSRLYTEFYPECIERIEIIRNAKAVGFSLNEIKDCLNDYYDGNLSIDKRMVAVTEKLAQAKREQVALTNAINQLTARYKVLEEMKSNNNIILSKDEWRKRIAELLPSNPQS